MFQANNVSHLQCRLLDYQCQSTKGNGLTGDPKQRSILFKNRKAYLFAVLHQALNVLQCCISTWQSKTPCSTPCNNVPILPLASPVPRSEPDRTHLGLVGQMRSRQSECSCKHVKIVPGTPVGVGGHPSTVIHNLIQSMPFDSWKGHTRPTALHVPQLQNRDG